ncbi:hypothetical protein GALL_408430 [mine drainage metagenome]|uniref:Uncharacterized protein n=1 Tax=mine drainage metagenome TaxID=410659 RepID=A0A1J5QIZ1_9ZZZZ
MPRTLGERVRAGPGPLLLHERTERRLVDVDALLGRHLQREVDREAVRVVQRERLVPGDDGSAARRRGTLRQANRGVEDRRPGDQRAPERLFLGVRDARDPLEIGLEVRVGRRHRVLAHRKERRQRQALDAEQAHGPHTPAQEPAQDVAASLVRRGDAVTDQHERGAHVVGHHPHPDVVLVHRAVTAPRELLRGLDDREDLVDLVHVVLALEQVRDPLEAHAGVDVLLLELAEQREVLLAAARAALVLHEHEVPDLQVAVLVDDRTTLGTELGPTVDVDLRAGSGRPRLPGGPEVVLHPATLDPLVREARDPLPEQRGLVVVVVHRDPDRLRVEPVATLRDGAGDQLPRVGDRPLLEVVAEGEVAVHLEERAMTGRLADLVDVQRAHALLHARRTRPRRRLLPEHVRDERHHPGDREQEGRVLGDQGGRGDDGVTSCGEEVEPTLADLGGTHVVLGRPVSVVGAGPACRSSGSEEGVRKIPVVVRVDGDSSSAGGRVACS